jgi:hypothetical protein
VRERSLPQLEQNLKLALTLSQEIYRLAVEKQWSEMEQLDRKRIQLLEAIFADPELSTSKKSQDQVEQIVALNDQAMSLCEEAREGLIEDGKKLKRGKEAVRAYRKQSKE